jgi:hypothetical protein
MSKTAVFHLTLAQAKAGKEAGKLGFQSFDFDADAFDFEGLPWLEDEGKAQHGAIIPCYVTIYVSSEKDKGVDADPSEVRAVANRFGDGPVEEATGNNQNEEEIPF